MAKYRALFRRVGEPWLWFSRLVMADRALIDIIHDDDIEVYAVMDPMGIEVGILELDFRSLPDCELSFFALIPDLAGKGHGPWLIAHAHMLAWGGGLERVGDNTCTVAHITPT